MMETESRIPVPEPMTPIRSEKMEISPMIMPPQAAATGMYLLSTVRSCPSWYPEIIMLSSLSFLAMSLGDSLLISIQILRINELLPSEESAANHDKEGVH